MQKDLFINILALILWVKKKLEETNEWDGCKSCKNEKKKQWQPEKRKINP